MLHRDLHQERRWTAKSLPRRRLTVARGPGAGFDFTAAMIALCEDIADRSPDFAHIDMSRVLVTAVFSRNRSKFGLQARVTPMRMKGAALTRRHRGYLYGLQRYYVVDREVYYLLTFVLPRFLNHTFEEKLTTVFHELYHMSAAFDGDIRRHPGRYTVHTHSKAEYDEQMHAYAKAYLNDNSPPEIVDFLKNTFDDFQTRHGGVTAVVVPQPRFFPITKLSA